MSKNPPHRIGGFLVISSRSLFYLLLILNLLKTLAKIVLLRYDL